MSDSKESPCPVCGEMVRINSLRCYNCGAFMNPELEEKYMEMQARPQETIYSDLPDGEVASLPDSIDDDSESGQDDFELSMPTSSPVVAEANESSELGGLPTDLNDPSSAKPKEPIAPEAPPEKEDDLFKIAMQDERQLKKQRKKRAQRGGMKTPGGGLIIFCPYGCRMVVKESHRGMQGKCPECKAPFIVPVEEPDFSNKKEKTGAEEETTAKPESTWLLDLHLHTVNPEKLKLKADSLLKDFTQADFGVANDQLIVTVFNKKERAKIGKEDDPREAVKQQLAAGKSAAKLDVSEKYVFSKEELTNLKVVQPSASRADSIFHGIDVFGGGRIALQLPAVEGKTEILYVSMGITQFWDLKKLAEEKLDVSSLGENAGIPPEASLSTHRCQITDLPVKSLDHIEFYKADSSVELETVGFECGKCHIAISEQGRQKENLGGKAGKGIAKAKCPKCGSKMGDHLLFNIKQTEEAAATS